MHPDALKRIESSLFPEESDMQTKLSRMESDLFPEEPQPGRTVGGTLKDVGLSLAKGAVSLGESAVGFADIPTGGLVGKAMENYLGYDPQLTKQVISQGYSPAQKRANQRLEDADGFLNTVKTASQNPSTVFHAALESLPLMGGGAAVGRKLIQAGAQYSPIIAAAIGEGGISAGLTASNIRQESETNDLSFGQSIASLGAGAGTGTFALAGGRIAQKLGVADPDVLLVGAGTQKTSKNVGRRIIEGGISEGVFEELPQEIQETIWVNAALDKPLLENVPESAAMGMMAGGVMGGGAQALTRTSPADTQTAIDSINGDQAAAEKVDDTLDKVIAGQEMDWSERQIEIPDTDEAAVRDYLQIEADIQNQRDQKKLADWRNQSDATAEFVQDQQKRESLQEQADRQIEVPEVDETAWGQMESRERSAKALEERNERIRTGYRPFADLEQKLGEAGVEPETLTSQTDTAPKGDNNLEKVTDDSGKVDKTPVSQEAGPVIPMTEIPAQESKGGKSPQLESEQSALPGKPGKKGVAYTNDNTQVNFTYQTVPLESLVPSHDDNMGVNPAYPKELQPRDRSRVMSSVQVENIAKKLNPERLGESSSVAHGAPIVLPDGTVLSGNGRVLALKKASEFGTIDKYQEYLRQNADKFGTDGDGVLVRVVDPNSIGDPVSFAQKANESDVAKMSATEQAMVDSGNLTEDDMATFRPSEDGDLAAPSNKTFLERFVQKMSPEERSGYLTEDGSPSRQLIDRVQQAIFQKAYGSESLLKMTAEEANPEIKNILNGLQAGARDFARTRTLNPELTEDVVRPIMEAVEFIRKAQRENKDLKGGIQNQVKQALSQMDMFEGALSGEAKTIAEYISQNVRSGKRIGELVKEIGSLHRKTLAEINQRSIFGEEEQQESILDRAIRILEEKYGTGTEVNQRAADQVSESLAQRRRGRTEQKEGQEKDQVSEPLQGDLFNANPQTEKQLDLFPEVFGNQGKPKASGNKKNLKPSQKGKGQSAQRDIQLDQTQRVGVQTTGYIQHRGLVAESPSDIAALFAHLVNEPQEHLYTVALDKDGQIIEIHRYTKGVKGASQANPGEMAGRIFAHKNAKKAYFVHNHPSGDATPSAGDMDVARRLKNILRLRGIKMLEHVVVSQGENGVVEYQSFNDRYPIESGTAPKTIKKTSIPVVERVFIEQKRKKDTLLTDAAVKKAMENRPSGFLLLSAKGKEVGFLPFPSGMSKKEITALLIEAADKTNAAMYVAYSKNSNEERIKFLDDLQWAMATSAGGIHPARVVVEYSDGSTSGISPPNPDETPEQTFVKVDKSTPVYQTANTDRTPGTGLTVSDIQKRFPKQAVFVSPDGSISIRMKNGMGLRITSVEHIGGDDIRLAKEQGRMDENGVILGKYQSSEITLNKNLADSITRDHEVYHFLADNILNKLDRAVIKGRAKKMNKDGTFNFKWSDSMEENEANTFAQLLSEREQYRDKPLGRIIQKVQDFFDAIWNIGRQSARKLAREVESGRIFERNVNGQTVQTTVPQFEQTAATFYSQMRNVLEKKLNKGPGKMVKNQVEAWAKKGEFKQDELEWSGLLPWLEEQKTVTKQDVLDYLDRNQVRIEVVETGGGQPKPVITAIQVKDYRGNEPWAKDYEGDNWIVHRNGEAMFVDEDATTEAEAIQSYRPENDDDYDTAGDTKFSEYQEPGGTNYREMLLTLPVQRKPVAGKIEHLPNGKWKVTSPGNTVELFDTKAEAVKETERLGKIFSKESFVDTSDQYRSSHFDEPNILVHVRMNERTGPNGERVLFLEEIQSDWSQEGRKKGFKGENKWEVQQNSKGKWVIVSPDGRTGTSVVPMDSKERATEILNSKEFRDTHGEGPGTGVPHTPFKQSKSWAMLAMKKAVRYAAENGYDSIAWTTGETQAARYDLSKHVRSIEWNGYSERGAAKLVSITPTDGNVIELPINKKGVVVDGAGTQFDGKAIDDVVGKDIAEKILSDKYGELSGDGLKVGGEGMKGFYDKILPAEVNKFFNKAAWGKAKVEQVKIPAVQEEDIMNGLEREEGEMQAWTLPITPEMKSKALREGMPLFATKQERYATTADRVPADAYERIKKQNKNLKNKAILSFSRVKNEVVKGLDKYMGSISTRLGNINPKLSAQVKTLDIKINKKTSDDSQLVVPLLQKARKMTRDDYAVWDFALKNSDGKKLKELHEKYGMEEEYQKVREMLDRIRQEAIDVGYEVGEIAEYWPRVLKDQQGFLEATERGSERPVFTDAIKKRAEDMGMKPWELSDEQRAEIISNVILGKYYGIPGPGAVKHRVFDVIPDKYNQFYMDSTAAIIHHIHSMRKRIEARKFFGKTPEYITAAKKNMRSAEARLRRAEDPDKIRDIQKDIDYYRAIVEKYKHQRDYTDNIDTYILDLMKAGDINPSQENTVREVLNARFNEVGVRGLIQAYKNFSYIDTMGSFTSAITQIGDLAWSFYDNGFFPTLRVLPAAIRNKSRITRKEVGFDRIAQEFSDTDQLGKAVSWVFKWTGLEKVDGIGKETLMNGAYNKYKKMAQNNPNALKSQIRHIFEKETDSVVQDLIHDDITDNVRLLVAHKVLDFQPMALSEMPEKYLTGGNGRLFYMLKTFTIKSFDVFRREAYNKIKSKDKAEKIQGLKNLTRLAMFFVLANAAADELKDLLLGRETELSDRLVDNMLRLFGISKFVTWQARTEGVGTAAGKQIFPPFKFVDGVYKDIVTAGDDKGLKSLSSVPIVGKLMYWHMGRGSYNRRDLWEKRFTKEKRRLNKVKDRYEKAKNKNEFRMNNRKDLIEIKRVNKIQGTLNKYQRQINNLKSMEQTETVKNRIERLQEQRIKMIKRYLK